MMPVHSGFIGGGGGAGQCAGLDGCGHGVVAQGSQATRDGGGATPASAAALSTQGCPSPSWLPFAASYHTFTPGSAILHVPSNKYIAWLGSFMNFTSRYRPPQPAQAV